MIVFLTNVAEREPSEMFEFVAESLDRVADFAEIRVEAERVLSIGLGQDIGPATALAAEITKSVSIVALVDRAVFLPPRRAGEHASRMRSLT